VKVKCKFNKCEAYEIRLEIPKHEKECKFGMKMCEHCKNYFNVDVFEEHLSKCDEMLIDCDLQCATKIKRKDRTSHILKDCLELGIECILACGKKIKRKGLKWHIEESCEETAVQCKLKCGETMKRKDLFTHWTVCSEMLVFCELTCGEVFKRREQQRHTENCNEGLVSCDSGCGMKIKLKHVNLHKINECVNCNSNSVEIWNLSMGSSLENLVKKNEAKLDSNGSLSEIEKCGLCEKVVNKTTVFTNDCRHKFCLPCITAKMNLFDESKSRFCPITPCYMMINKSVFAQFISKKKDEYVMENKNLLQGMHMDLSKVGGYGGNRGHEEVSEFFERLNLNGSMQLLQR